MSKYDYGYELVPESTIEWAYNKIKVGSNVLELGPANGNLVYHLSSEKKCHVDIVELDEESGLQAAKYARNICIGKNEGNLEQDIWFNKLKGNQYEYIIILDVLEHIKNPLAVLTHLKTLLKDDGYILLSIPNIAHNSVILNLLRNKFDYTSVGLLDDTHVHFYSYESAKAMLHKIGLITVREEVKQKKVGTNEINVDYDVFPREVEAYLKTREFGTAYQFLFTIQKGELQSNVPLEYDYCFDYLYQVVAFDANNGTILSLNAVNPLERISLEIDIPFGTKVLRIDPLNTNCIITDVRISSDSIEQTTLSIKEYTGTLIDDLFVFYDDDPQIYIEVPDSIRHISFSCKCLDFDNSVLSRLIDLKDLIRQHENDLEELKALNKEFSKTIEKNTTTIEKQKLQLADLTENLQTTNATLQRRELVIQDLNMQYSHQGEQLKKTEHELADFKMKLKEQEDTCFKLTEELNKIQNTVWGKAYYKFTRNK